MAEVKWIKVSTEMFNSNRKIKQIELMPEGDTILVIWLKLLLLAGNINDGGAIYLTPEIPYTEEMLANELRRPLTTVKLALKVFEQFGMIQTNNDIRYLTSWEKHQNVERLSELREYNRLAQQKSRAKKKLLNAGIDNVNDMSMTSQRRHDIEEDIEEDKEKDKEYHSFILADEKEKFQLKFLQGELGKGVVMLNDAQFEDLLDRLSIEEFEKYVGIVADMELNGKRYKRKSHYQAILDMAMKDRKTT